MNTFSLTSGFSPMEHEFVSYKEDVELFYEAYRNGEYMKCEKLLHNIDNTGLSDTFKRDYDFACKVLQAPTYVNRYWISYLFQDLPSPNKSFSKEEQYLVQRLVEVATDGICPLNCLNKTLKRDYKDMLQVIKSAKTLLINLNKDKSA